MQPFLTFIVPCYNAELYVQHCIDSVLAQSIQEWELLLIDDGSSDNTTKICQYAQKLDSRIVYIHQENKGVSSARNKGLQLATGEFITCIDADDWIEPNFIDVFKKEHLADINICGYREMLPDGSEKSRYAPSKLFSRKPLDTYTVRNSSFRTPWAVVFRHDFFKKHHIQFDESLSWGEDTMLLLKATRLAKGILFVPDVIYNYRFTGVGLTNSPKRHQNIVQFLDSYLQTRNEMAHQSIVAITMMNELILFLSVILLNEVLESEKTEEEKLQYVTSIHHYFKNMPFWFTLRTKVGRIRYLVAICSRFLSPKHSYKLYTKIG